MKRLQILVVFILCVTLLSGCVDSETKQTTQTSVASRDSTEQTKGKFFPINWKVDVTVPLSIDTNIRYESIEYDSVVAVDYVGFESGGRFYYPINENGQWINTIFRTRKLTDHESKRVNKIITDPKNLQ